MLGQTPHTSRPPTPLPEILVAAKGAAQALFRRLVAVEDFRSETGSVGAYDLKDKRLASDVQEFILMVESLCKRPDFGSDRAEGVTRAIVGLRQQDCFEISLTEALDALTDSEVDFFQKGAAATQVINAIVRISMLLQRTPNIKFVENLSFETAREFAELGNEVSRVLREPEIAKPMASIAQKARALTGELLTAALEGGANISLKLLDQLTELRALTLSVEKMALSKGVNREVQETIATKLRRKLSFS